MALDNSAVTSSSSARRWADRISNVFKKEVSSTTTIDTIPPVCVFQVPTTLVSQMPEAYAPQLIALGPYHHLRPELYSMQRYKLSAVKEMLRPSRITHFQTLVIDKLKAIDHKIRACYNKFMDYDEDTLAWIIAIDGLFLLNFVSSFSLLRGRGGNRVLMDNTIFTRDIMMLENQVPVILLKEIWKNLGLNASPNDHDDLELLGLLLAFCMAYSPLSFVDLSINSRRYPLHLLDLMYHLIVDSRSSSIQIQEVNVIREVFEETRARARARANTRKEDDEHTEEDLKHNMEVILDAVEAIGSKKTNNIIQPVKVATSMPWSMISGIFRTGTKFDGEDSDEEIQIPSVTYLLRYGGIKCVPFKGSLSEIKFVEEEGILYLPIITL